MKLTQHIPNYADVDERERVIFTTLEEMLAGEWPASFQKDKGFYRFSLSHNRLMAEYDNGYKWWVVGFFSEGDLQTLGLPKWVAKEHPKPRPLGVPRLRAEPELGTVPTWRDIVFSRSHQ